MMNFRRLILLVSVFLTTFCLVLHSSTVNATAEESRHIRKRLPLAAPLEGWRATLYLLNAGKDETHRLANLEDFLDESIAGINLQVFAYLDLQSILNLSQVSKKIYANSRDARFLADCGVIHLEVDAGIQAQAWNRISRQPDIARHMIPSLLDAIKSSSQQVSNLEDSQYLAGRVPLLEKSMAILIALTPILDLNGSREDLNTYDLGPDQKAEILDSLWGAYQSFSRDAAVATHANFSRIETTLAEILIELDPEIMDSIAAKIPQTGDGEQNSLEDQPFFDKLFKSLVKKNPAGIALKLLNTLHNSNHLCLQVYSAWALGPLPKDQRVIDGLKQVSMDMQNPRRLQNEAKTALGYNDPTHWYDLMIQSDVEKFYRDRVIKYLKASSRLDDNIIDRIFTDVLTHNSYKVRLYITDLLISGQIRDMRLTPTLLQIFKNDAVNIVKSMAGRGLARYEPETLFSFLSYKNPSPKSKKSKESSPYHQPVHKNGNLRLQALGSMQNLEDLNDRSLAVISKAMLVDPNSQVRSEAVNLLALFDVRIEAIYHDLLKAVRGDRCTDVKANALNVLVKNFGAARAEVRAILFKILEDETKPHLLISTMDKLANFPTLERQECINMRSSVARHLLSHPNARVRIAAAKTICRLKWRDADTASALVKAFKKDGKPGVRDAVVNTLHDLELWHLVSDPNME